MHGKFRDLHSSASKAFERERKLNEDLRSMNIDVEHLCARVEELKHFEERYKNWKAKEPEFLHYLRSFSALAK
jgi:hypothetical protein